MKKTRLTPSTTPSVARASRTQAATTTTTTGTKAVATATTRVLIASAQAKQHCRGYPALCERQLKEDLRRLKDLLKEKCLWHLDGNHTTEQCYQLRRALKDTPEPRPPHDKKGKKKADEGNDDSRNPTRR
jgi:hypothetical protein